MTVEHSDTSNPAQLTPEQLRANFSIIEGKRKSKELKFTARERMIFFNFISEYFDVLPDLDLEIAKDFKNACIDEGFPVERVSAYALSEFKKHDKLLLRIDDEKVDHENEIEVAHFWLNVSRITALAERSAAHYSG